MSNEETITVDSLTNMKELVLNVLSKSEILIVDKVEHEFQSSGDNPMLLFTLRLAKMFSCGLILGTNVPMIIFTLNQGSKTFLDWLIVIDCFLCLGNIYGLLLIRPSYVSYDDIGFCEFHSFLMYFIHLCNRLLTLGIAIYRFTLVNGYSLVFTTNQKKNLEIFISLFILITSLIITGLAIYNREDYRNFLGNGSTMGPNFGPRASLLKIYIHHVSHKTPILACSGKLHQFFYNLSDFYQLKTIGGPHFSLPITNPVRIGTIVSFCSYMVVTPVCYASIYR